MVHNDRVINLKKKKNYFRPQRVKDTNGCLTRWSLFLQSYQYSIPYRSGKQSGNANALSRFTMENRTTSGTKQV